MNFIKRLQFRQKILIILLPALLGLAYFAAINVVNSLAQDEKASLIEPLVMLTAEHSLVVHELQKERGATAGFLGSKGTKFSDMLQTQRQHTSQMLNERARFLEAEKGHLDNPKVVKILEQVNRQLSQISSIRARVDNQEIPLKEALGYYVKLNSLLLSVGAEVAHIADKGSIANRLQAYYNFLQGKERAGIERAVLSNTFALGSFAPGMYQKFIQLITEQATYFDNFSKAAEHELLADYNDAMRAPSVQQVKMIRNQVLDQAASGDFGIDATRWFKEATGRINQLKQVEDILSAELLEQTAQQKALAHRVIIENVVITLLVLVIVLYMAIATAGLLTTQLSSLAAAIDAAGREKDLSARAKIITQDELGVSAGLLNDMLSSFEKAIKDIDKGSVQLAAVAEETSMTVDGNLQTLDRQHDETTLVATATEQMTVTVQEVANNTASTSQAAKEVENLADDGVKIVVETVGNMNKLSGDMENASQAVMQLKEESKRISSVVDVIKSVAEQTNLLALNAAIEAARAGDQGRGFAVVADEVRTLAQRTQSSTEEIEGIVTSFQESAGVVSKSIELCAVDATESVEQTGAMEQKLIEIQRAIENINNMCLQVASAVEEQVAVTNDIASNARSINDLADQETEGGREISKAADDQARLAGELQALSSSFKVK